MGLKIPKPPVLRQPGSTARNPWWHSPHRRSAVELVALRHAAPRSAAQRTAGSHLPGRTPHGPPAERGLVLSQRDKTHHHRNETKPTTIIITISTTVAFPQHLPPSKISSFCLIVLDPKRRTDEWTGHGGRSRNNKPSMKNSKKLKTLPALALLLWASFQITAQVKAVTIDFSSAPPGPTFLPFSENGFTFTQLGGGFDWTVDGFFQDLRGGASATCTATIISH